MLTENIRVRLDAALLAMLPKRRRSAFIRITIKHYLANRERRRPIPVALPEELVALRDTVDQLRRIGFNLNQIARQFNAVARTGAEPPTIEKVEEISCQIDLILKATVSVLNFWLVDKEIEAPLQPIRVTREAK